MPQTRFRVEFVAAVLLLLAPSAGRSGSPVDDSSAYVEINGTRITIGDLQAKKPALLFQARNNYYEAQRKAVDEFINDYLLEQQAGKEHVTVAELLQRHINDTIAKDPSDDALRVYYEGLDVKEPFDAVRDKIVGVIRERRLARAKTAYLQSLRSQANVAIRLAPPRAVLSTKDTPLRGNPDAPVLVVEYADFECPYCQQMEPVLKRLSSEYKEKVTLAFKDAPLPMHSHAQKAAEAAHCAGAQGRYWEYHDLLFQTKDYSLGRLKENARGLGLDGNAFDQCLDSGQTADVVKAQLTEAQALGVPGTPAFFINGRFLNPNGNVTYETLRQLIEEELQTFSAQAKAPAARGSE